MRKSMVAIFVFVGTSLTVPFITLDAKSGELCVKQRQTVGSAAKNYKDRFRFAFVGEIDGKPAAFFYIPKSFWEDRDKYMSVEYFPLTYNEINDRLDLRKWPIGRTEPDIIEELLRAKKALEDSGAEKITKARTFYRENIFEP